MNYKYLYYIGTLITFVGWLVACASIPHVPRDSVKLDPDRHVMPDVALEEPVVIRMPNVEEHDDCNKNSIHDAFDIAGLIPRGPYQVGANPKYLTAGDFDGDGDTDIATSNNGDGTVTILWQRSNRRFDRSRTVSLNNMAAQSGIQNPKCIARLDDGDGYNDLVVAPGASSPYRSAIHIRNGREQLFDLVLLQMPPSGSSAFSPHCVTVTDIDNNNHPDILATAGLEQASCEMSGIGAPALTQYISLFRNTGSGEFAAPESFVPTNLDSDSVVITNMRDLTSADLDKDGYPEVIVKGACLAGVLKNEAESGTPFADWQMYTLDPNTETAIELDAIFAADVEFDYGDNLVALLEDGIVNVLQNTNGSLSYPDMNNRENYQVGSGGGSMGAGDIDNDGDIDIVVAVPSADSVALLRNHINLSLMPPIFLPVLESPTGLFVGNLDRDSRAEIAVSNTGTDDVWILHVRPEPVSVDCNKNGRPDRCDISDDPTIDQDADGVPDSCERNTMGGSAYPD